ncbi:MAG: dienelactone hydrolase family protein [Steroidobacteraceae bacterium]
MCDQDSFDDMLQYDLKAVELSRRRFAALGVGLGASSLLPRIAGAVEVKDQDVEIKTADGTCDAHFAHPASGKGPAVLVWPDIFGLRASFKQMGRRLAESGYSVLTVNPFYRLQKAPTSPQGANMQDPEVRTKLVGQMGSLTAETHVADSTAFMAWLDRQSSVDVKKKAGTTGYCMGGPITMRAAAAMPSRIGAAASFHGAALVTDKPDSPHLLVPKMKARYLFAIAQNDDQGQPEAKTVLRDTFAKAKLPAEIEVYPAQHGWCPPDGRVYDHDQAEKAWARLLALFKAGLV